MYPYVEYFDPEEIGYTDLMKQELLGVAKQVDAEGRYRQYVSLGGYTNQLEYFGLQKHTGIGADDFEITQRMRSLIQPQHKVEAAIYVKFAPRARIAPHVDDHLERSTCLTFPLAPEPPDFAPTLYFKSMDDIVKPCYIEEWENRPGALNTREVHAVFNNEHLRYSFQLCFRIPLKEFVELHRRGEMFRG